MKTKELLKEYLTPVSVLLLFIIYFILFFMYIAYKAKGNESNLSVYFCKPSDYEIVGIMKLNMKKGYPVKVKESKQYADYFVADLSAALALRNKTGIKLNAIVSRYIEDSDDIADRVFVFDSDLFYKERSLREIRKYEITEINYAVPAAVFSYSKKTFFSAEVNYLTALGYYKKGRFKEAIKYFEELPSPLKEFYSGNCLLLSGKTQAAVEQYEAALKKYPAFSEAYANLAALYEMTGYYDTAKYYAEKAIALDSSNPVAYYVLGMTYLNNNQAADAVEFFRLAKKTGPDMASARVQLGLALAKTGNAQQAVKEATAGIKMNNSAAYYYVLAEIFALSGKNDEAYEACKMALELDDRNFKALNKMGEIYEQRKEYKKAMAAYNKAIGFEPDYGPPYINLGMLLRKLKRFEEAAGYLEKMTLINPGVYETYHNMALVSDDLGYVSLAIDFYKQALEMNPRSYDTNINLAMILGKKGRYREALEYLKAAMQLREKPYLAYYKAALIADVNADTQNAVYFYSQAINAKPDYGEAYYYAGALAEWRKDYIMAPAYYLDAYRFSPGSLRASEGLLRTMFYGGKL